MINSCNMHDDHMWVCMGMHGHAWACMYHRHAWACMYHRHAWACMGMHGMCGDINIKTAHMTEVKTGPKGALQQYACMPPSFSELLAQACTCDCLFPWQPYTPFAQSLEITIHRLQCPAKKFKGIRRSFLSSTKESLDILTIPTTTSSTLKK